MDRLSGVFSKEEYTTIMDNICRIAMRNTVKFCEYFPDLSAENGMYRYFDDFYDACHGGWWTGIFYMLYGYSGDKRFLHYAETLSEKFYELVRTRRIYHREMGFIYQPICVNNIYYSGSKKAEEMLLLSSDYMSERFIVPVYNPNIKLFEGNIVKASYLVNSILLYAANRINGSSKYLKTAELMESYIYEYIIKPDGFCNMEVENSKNIIAENLVINEDVMLQKNKVLWRRGHAWTLFGLSLYYVYKKDLKYVKDFDLVITNLLNDKDVNINGDSLVFNLDTTSLSIICCALAEVVKKLPQSHDKYDLYKNIFKNNIRYLADNFLLDSSWGCDAFLDGGVFTKNNVKQTVDGGLRPTVCGDYHFLQALMHIDENYISCWNIDKLVI